jgi:iron(III) transport system permease protein
VRLLLTLLCALLALPVAAVLLSWFAFDANAAALLRHLVSTVLGDYALQSLVLAGAVGVGVMVVGAATAVAVTLFDFPGRKVFEWALLLPLAMPAYVLAYAWTDALQYSGPLQRGFRASLGVEGALWPDVRSLGGAAVLFVLCLYPYVYLLARTALGERAVQMMEAARMLGAGLKRRLWEVALPLARPALAAGTALALMETLADYGVGAFFGLSTFTTGIYKAWLSMNDAVAAAQLASILLLVVAVLLALERWAQRRLRFAHSKGHAQGSEAKARRLHGVGAALAWLLCALPIALGFILPVGWLLYMLAQEAVHGEAGRLPWDRFAQWAWASFRLAGTAALVCTAVALALAGALRLLRGRQLLGLPVAARVLSLGYAVPGAVVAIGILMLMGAAQARWPQLNWAGWVTGSLGGVLYAYLVRFSAVALQSVETGYTRMPLALDESARMLGAKPWRIYARIHVPLLQRTTLAALLLVFVDVMKELPATLVLRPFGSDTLAVVAYNLARDERLGEAALPSLAIVAVGLLPVMLLSRAMRQR